MHRKAQGVKAMRARLWPTLGVAVVILVLSGMVLALASCGEKATKTTAPETTQTTVATTQTTAGGAETTAPSATETTAPAGKTEVLKIGGSVPLSGPPSPGGIAARNGWSIAVDMINDRGGVKIGDTAYKLQLFAEDNKGTADAAATATTKLCLQEGIKFILGDIADFTVPVIYKVTSEAGALLVSTLSVNACDIPGQVGDVSPDRPLMIRSMPAQSELYMICPQYLVDNYPQAKSVALMALDFPDYDSYKEVYTEKFKPLGLTVSTYERISTDMVDFVPLVTRVLQSKPDAVYLLSSAMSQVPMIFKTFRDQGFKGPLMWGSPTDPAYIVNAAPDITDAFGLALYLDDPNLPAAVKEVVDRGRATLGKDFVSDSVMTADQVLLVAQLLEKAQSTDPKAVVAKLETLTNPGDLQSVYGPAYAGGLQKTGVRHVIVRPWPLSRIVNGKAEQVGFFTVDVP